MDKYEYKLRSEEIDKLMEAGKYTDAVEIADTIDWRRVKSTITLQKISELYKANRRFEECRDLLLLAYDRNPGNRYIVFALCEVSLEFDDILNAIEYFKEFTKLSPRDPQAYVLRYKIYEAQNVAIEERIELLEELKKKDRIEEWEYQLAYLYHRAGMKTQCVEECNEFILWFGEGPYVMKAMELKMLHEPLSEQQQQKYDRFCEERVQGGVAITEPNEDGVDFRVKTINIGAYNTMDLQAELAENLKEYIDSPSDYTTEGEQEEMTMVMPVDSDHEGYYNVNSAVSQPSGSEEYRRNASSEQGEDYSLETDTEAEEVPEETAKQEGKTREQEILAKQHTVVDKQEVFFEDKTGDIRFQIQQPEISEGVDPKLEEWKRDFADQFSEYENPGPMGQLSEEVSNEEETVTMKTPVVTVPIPPISTRDVKEYHMTQEGTVVPGAREGHTDFESVLFQGNDGQISLVVPEETKSVEKQITGQLNINDILADWERMKKENEQKRQEEVRKRVLEQTGQIFSDFDLTSKSGFLEGLDEQEEPIVEDENSVSESEEEVTHTDDAMESSDEQIEILMTTEIQPTDDENSMEAEEGRIEVIAETVSDEAEDIEIPESVMEAELDAEDDAFGEGGEAEEEALTKGSEEDRFYGAVTAEIPGSIWKEVAEAEAKEKLDVVSLEENDTEGMEEEDTMGVYGEDEQEESADLPEETVEDTKATGTVTEQARDVELTPDEEQLFEPFLYSPKMKKQIIAAIDHISLASYAGNVIIAGEAGSGAMHMAKCLVRHVQIEDGNFSGNVAKISGETLNRKDVTTILTKLSNGALVVEKANQMNEKTIDAILRQINHEGNGILIFLLDRKKEIEQLLEKCPSLTGFFDVRITILPMNNDVLVGYGRRYAYDLEYSIDEMGILALYKRIADMQTGRHAVTVVEVKKIIDEAIRRNKKKTLSTFANLLSGKRYDEEDMIILKEKDFTN